jgi:transcriptional regulator with GAF, ATPase, and Fis domain
LTWRGTWSPDEFGSIGIPDEAYANYHLLASGKEFSVSSVSADQLAKVFVEVADTLVDEFDLIEFLHLVTSRSTELVETAAAGLLLADHRGQLQFMAASTEEARLLELFQVQIHEGPCQDAFRSGAAVLNADLTTATARWPQFAPHAVRAGYRSVHAFPLRLRAEVIGALNLFGVTNGRLDPDDARIIQALADVATIAILQERTIHRGEVLTEQLQSALNSRVVIEQAKGVTAQKYDVSVSEAFELLRSYARRTRQRLVDVATAVVSDSGHTLDLAGD